MAEKHLSGKNIFQQLVRDLIGKDSHRGVTLTYSWLANQLGHFSLGFFPAMALYKLIDETKTSLSPEFIAGLSISGLWFAFEVFNLFYPLRKKNTVNKTFKPSWGNLIFDTSTDIVFFAFGAFMAAFAMSSNTDMLYIALALLALLLYPIRFWYVTKMYQQEAKFPFQARLSQLEVAFSNDDRDKIVRFMSDDNEGQHLLIFGAHRSGKTSLSVAIANEKAIKNKKAHYSSATKLLDEYFQKSIANPNELGLLWDWSTTEYLVIDDVNPSIETGVELISAQQFKSLLLNTNFQERNKKVLSKVNHIWVLGDQENDSIKISSQWNQMLVDCGVPAPNIHSVFLKKR